MESEQLVFVSHQVNMMQIDTMQNNNFLQKNPTRYYGYSAEFQINTMMRMAANDHYAILFWFAERKDSSNAQVESEKEIRTNGNGGPR